MVKRYDMLENDGYPIWTDMRVAHDGKYVLHSDYAALERELTELRKGGEPRKRAGRVFWKVWGEWQALPEEEKRKSRICGGCVRF